MTDAVAKPMTLGDVLQINTADRIIVLNELNELLVELAEVSGYICKVNNQLSPELLNRAVVATGISGDDFVIKVAGEEDAE